MNINVLTLFPEILNGPMSESIINRAREKRLINLRTVNIRDFSSNSYKQVDDQPYGGGPGMIMQIEPIYKAVKSVQTPASKLILMTPKGQTFNQKLAKDLTNETDLVFICGHYEGVDERVREIFNPLTLSIGNYVLTNGAIAACVVIDAVTRLLPGVLGNNESLNNESFENDLIEYPQYTRPASFKGFNVPEILLSGNHKKIQEWREEQAKLRTNIVKHS